VNSKRFLGPLDAADDPHFKDNFVPQDEIYALATSQSHIVYGAKGVGKTALCRAITELDRDTYFASGIIDLNTLSFERVHTELEKLKDATGEATLALARATWTNVIVMYFLELVKNHRSTRGTLAAKIDDLLRAEYFSARSASTRLLNQVERIFQRLGAIGLYGDFGRDNYGVTETKRMAVDQFPPSETFREILEAACKIVVASHRSVAVCIDGFDSIVDHEADSRKAIFAGLVDAIYRLAGDPLLRRTLCVKAFLPKELTHEARKINWDADKFLYNTRQVQWTQDTLQEFLAKRLSRLLKAKKTDFDGIWHEFMPRTVHNAVHKLDEDSFQYILRHTQFRPRQLLFHMQSILDRWDHKSKVFKVDSSLIPSTVAASNKLLAELAVNQLEYSLPGISTFMRSFGGLTSTISYSECYSKIARMFEKTAAVEVRGIFEELFDFGVLGVARRSGVADGGATVRVRFSYAGKGVISVNAAEDDIVAVAPMFQDYCGCMPSAYGAVVPSIV
jgi:hypothetical protein